MLVPKKAVCLVLLAVLPLMVEKSNAQEIDENYDGYSDYQEFCKKQAQQYIESDECEINMCSELPVGSRSEMVEANKNCEDSCCINCSQHMPVHIRLLMILIKFLVMFPVVYCSYIIGKQYLEVRKEEKKSGTRRSKKAGSNAATTILVACFICSVLNSINHVIWLLYHVGMYTSAETRPFLGMDQPFLIWWADVPQLMLWRIAFVVAQLNCMCYWIEVFCSNNLKQKTNIVDSLPRIRRMTKCYIGLCIAVTLGFGGLFGGVRGYIFMYLINILVAICFQCYINCLTVSHARKILKALQESNSGKNNDAMSSLEMKMTKVFRGIGIYGTLFILSAFFPAIHRSFCLASGSAPDECSIPSISGTPGGGASRCNPEVRTEFYRSVTKLAALRIVFLLAEILRKGETKKSKEESKLATEVSVGGSDDIEKEQEQTETRSVDA